MMSPRVEDRQGGTAEGLRVSLSAANSSCPRLRPFPGCWHWQNVVIGIETSSYFALKHEICCFRFPSSLWMHQLQFSFISFHPTFPAPKRVDSSVISLSGRPLHVAGCALQESPQTHHRFWEGGCDGMTVIRRSFWAWWGWPWPLHWFHAGKTLVRDARPTLRVAACWKFSGASICAVSLILLNALKETIQMFADGCGAYI